MKTLYSLSSPGLKRFLVTSLHNGDNQTTVIELINNLPDSELNSCVSLLYELLCQNEVSTMTAAEEFASELSRYLTDHGATKPMPSTQTRKHHRTRPSRTTELCLAREKNQARTTFRDNPRQFLQLVQAHHRLMQTSRTQTAAKSAMKQNKPSGETPGSL